MRPGIGPRCGRFLLARPLLGSGERFSVDRLVWVDHERFDNKLVLLWTDQNDPSPLADFLFVCKEVLNQESLSSDTVAREARDWTPMLKLPSGSSWAGPWLALDRSFTPVLVGLVSWS